MNATPSAPTPEARPQVRVYRAGRNLRAAFTTAFVLIGLIVGTLLWWQWGFALLVATALSLGAWELHRAMQRLGMNSALVPIMAGTFLTMLGSYFAQLHPTVIRPQTVLISALSLTAIAALMWRIPKGPQGFVHDAAASLFTIAYLPLLGCGVPLMLGQHMGRERIVTYIACVMANDVGGYLFGVLFGKHKMAPQISPKKTWEGFVGSLLLAMVVGALFVRFLLHGPLWAGVILGVVAVVFGTTGDLVASMIKRDVGVKDMSNLLPGHGGIMDRLDSLVVAAPVAWLVLYLLVR